MTRSLKPLLLGLQHCLAMFGATVLVPLITGLSPAVALFTAGAGTLIFHACTKWKVPIFMGSSFAYLPVILLVTKMYGGGKVGLAYACGGIVVSGLVNLAMSILVGVYGVDKIKSFFPPVVTGPIIMVIGLTLSPTAVSMASDNWALALIVLATVIIVSIFAKGFFKLIPIISGVVVGYVAALAMGLIKAAPIIEAHWLAIPPFMLPKFSLTAAMIIAPIALVTIMEHVGEVTINGAVVGKDFLKDPGLNRTLLGDALATSFAGLVGGPDCTTYAENNAVLAMTKVYDPFILRIAAFLAIAMAFSGKFSAIINGVPTAVMGGISLILFGMIATIGIRSIAEAGVDFVKSRNLIIASIILVLGIGGVAINFTPNLQLAGMSLAAIVGVILNKILPEEMDVKTSSEKAA